MVFFQAASDLGIFHSMARFFCQLVLAQNLVRDFEKKCSRNHNGLAKPPKSFEIPEMVKLPNETNFPVTKIQQGLLPDFRLDRLKSSQNRFTISIKFSCQ